MRQILKTASVIAKLQTTLDVYEGLFLKKEDAKRIIIPFQEIGESIKMALSTQLIIGCAALFSDPEKSCGNENMSIKNLIGKYEKQFTINTQKVCSEINQLVNDMNLKQFRNKHVGHFGLEELLGFKEVESDITVNKLRKLLEKGQHFLNMIAHDSKLMPSNEFIDLYTEISRGRGTESFLKRVSTSA